MLASTDPVAVDLVAVRLMGFDERKIEKLVGPMRDEGQRITLVRDAEDVEVAELRAGAQELNMRSLDEITAEKVFEPHAGWVGHIERAENDQ